MGARHAAALRAADEFWNHNGRPPAGTACPTGTTTGTTTFTLPTTDPLLAEHRAFRDLLHGTPTTIADLDAGLRAVAVAETAAKSARTGTTQPSTRRSS